MAGVLIMSDRDFQTYRREFWTRKTLEHLRGELRDAYRRGDPLAVYRYRDELREFTRNLPA